MSEYVPGYDQAAAATTAGREAAQALMKLLTCEFDDLVINEEGLGVIRGEGAEGDWA